MAALLCCSGVHAAEADGSQPAGGSLQQTASRPVQGVQLLRLLLSSAVGIVPRLQPSYFETAPSEHPWVLWFEDTRMDASWYTLDVAPTQRLALTPLILNGAAASAASIGLVVSITY